MKMRPGSFVITVVSARPGPATSSGSAQQAARMRATAARRSAVMPSPVTRRANVCAIEASGKAQVGTEQPSVPRVSGPSDRSVRSRSTASTRCCTGCSGSQ